MLCTISLLFKSMTCGTSHTLHHGLRKNSTVVEVLTALPLPMLSKPFEYIYLRNSLLLQQFFMNKVNKAASPRKKS